MRSTIPYLIRFFQSVSVRAPSQTISKSETAIVIDGIYIEPEVAFMRITETVCGIGRVTNLHHAGNRTVTRFILLTILLMGLLIAQVDAATYYVATTGNDGNLGSSSAPWRTLQKSANTMVAGDTTIVKNGTYTQGELVFKTSGTSGARITLQAENQHLAILSSTSSCNPGISLKASYITIDGLRLTVSPNDVKCTASSTGHYHIHTWDSGEPVSVGNGSSGYTGAWIKNVQIDNSNGHRFGAIKTRQDNSLIENNVLHEELEVFRNINTISRDNTIYASVNGVVIKGGARNTQLYNNVIHLTGPKAIAVFVGGCTGDPWFFDTAAKIESYNAAVYNNVVLNDGTDQYNDAFVFRSASNAKVFNNVTVNLSPVAMMLSCATNPPPSANPTFVNNILIGNGATDVKLLATFSGTKTVDYNNFYNFASGVPTQAHAITGNPNLVNNTSDWHTHIGSPAIAAGTIVTMTGYDGAMIVVNRTRDGVMRPAGPAWDLGIYQANGAALDTTAPASPVNVRLQ